MSEELSKDDNRREQLISSAYNIIDNLSNATRAAKQKMKIDVAALMNPELEKWIKEQRKPKEEPTPQPKQIDKSKSSFTIPLKEHDIGKAGVSDLFDKQNEIIRYLNALKEKPKAP